jgi:hypothetical protein
MHPRLWDVAVDLPPKGCCLLLQAGPEQERGAAASISQQKPRGR